MYLSSFVSRFAERSQQSVARGNPNVQGLYQAHPEFGDFILNGSAQGGSTGHLVVPCFQELSTIAKSKG